MFNLKSSWCVFYFTSTWKIVKCKSKRLRIASCVTSLMGLSTIILNIKLQYHWDWYWHKAGRTQKFYSSNRDHVDLLICWCAESNFTSMSTSQMNWSLNVDHKPISINGTVLNKAAMSFVFTSHRPCTSPCAETPCNSHCYHLEGSTRLFSHSQLDWVTGSFPELSTCLFLTHTHSSIKSYCPWTAVMLVSHTGCVLQPYAQSYHRLQWDSVVNECAILFLTHIWTDYIASKLSTSSSSFTTRV